MQTIGDTTPELMREDMKLVEDIIRANHNRRRLKYWIVIAYKQHQLGRSLSVGQKALLSPEAQKQVVLKRHIKAYSKKPGPLMGTIVIEYDPQLSAITDTIVNLPDVPVNDSAIIKQIGGDQVDVAVKSDVPCGAYRYM